jgi:hypothetical protein
MAQPSIHKGKTAKELHLDYEGFIGKFKPKKTTDDCYTPTPIYEALIAWLQAKGYITPDTPVVRPFWPEGDFTDLEQYPPGAVVVDNPPFSIMHSIIHFYEQHNITFFLFAHSLTVLDYMSDAYDLTAIILGLSVVYENGAKVSTAFVTNLHCLDGVKAMTAPDLYQMLDNAQEENRKKVALPVYAYPDNVVTAARLHKIAHNVPFILLKKEVAFARALDAQRPLKKAIFGSGLLVSDDKAAELKAAELKAAELKAARETTVFRLSERERQIINNLE